MSTKRKKNSTNPAGKQVLYIKIHDDSPWEQDYYMCGMCGHAISYKTVRSHARDAHKASRIQLLEVEPGGVNWPADNTSGKSVSGWCDNCTHHVSYHKLEAPHACGADNCTCTHYYSQAEVDATASGTLSLVTQDAVAHAYALLTQSEDARS